VGLDRQSTRLLLDGKLSRHPRLDVLAGAYADSTQAVVAMDEVVRRYLNVSPPGISVWLHIEREESPMGNTMCPGQDTAFWRTSDIFEVACSQCGYELEFFKDDASRRCTRCGALVANPKLNLGCAQWCEHAKACLGYDPKELLMAEGGDTALVKRLIAAMQKTFGSDQKSITHALTVLERAKEIMRGEKEADPKVVLAAAVLHDIGIQEAERKHGSNAGRWQEIEGPPIAEAIMKELGVDKQTREHVGQIIANHHSARDIDTLEFRILWDANGLVNLPEEYLEHDKDKLCALIDKLFKTDSGKAQAYQRLLKKAPPSAAVRPSAQQRSWLGT
jgi:HD superfamily phosphodiesterase